MAQRVKSLPVMQEMRKMQGKGYLHQFSSVAQCLQPHGLQHARPPCLSPAPGVHSDSTSIELMMPTNHLILCHPLFLPPSVFPSIRVFSNESVICIRRPKHWSFSFSISPSKEYSGLISFRMDWLDPFAVQGTLKSLLQHHSLKASVLWHSAFLVLFQYSCLKKIPWTEELAGCSTKGGKELDMTE